MIINASSKPIGHCGLPNIQDALLGWMQKITISLLTKSVVDYQLKETNTNYETFGVLQPFTTKQLIIKPIGQRAWNWYSLWLKGTDIELHMDDVFLILGKRFRVMQKFEWDQYGFIEYQVIDDFGQNMSNTVNENISILDQGGYGA